MKNFREIEQLSAYLDGELNSSESARLETRIKSDPELESILSDLRSTRSLLKKLPARKAPRNFTLTRKMVGLNPPLPRTYSFFRLATTFATILFILTFSATALSPYFSLGGAAAPAYGYGYGGGGGGDAASMEAAEEPMLEMATEEPAPAAAVPAATETSANQEDMATEEAGRIMEATPEAEIAPKDVQPQSSAQEQPQELQPQPEVQNDAPASYTWTLLFLVIAVGGGVTMRVMRRSAVNKWK